MNTLGWTFQINGKGKLRLINDIDGDKIEVNYNPKHLANGKFGDYLKYKGENVSIPKDILSSLKSIDDLNISHVYDILQAKKEKSNNILRKIDGELYIANGKYGPYCYYKTAVMNKASFVSLKYYQGDYMNDEANNIYRFVKEQIQKPKAPRIKKNYK